MPSELHCDDLADDLAACDEVVLSASARTHVEACLRCQAELANHRRLHRSLRSLAAVPIRIDGGLHHEILLAVDREDDRLARRVPTRAAATIGGLAAAAGVIALATRQRRSTRLAG